MNEQKGEEASIEFIDLMVVGKRGLGELTEQTPIAVVLVARQIQTGILGVDWKYFSYRFLRQLEAMKGD